MLKHHHYVGVLMGNGSIRLVTNLDNVSKYATWDVNGEPFEMPRQLAEDIAFALRCNYFTAYVVSSLSKITEQIGVVEDEEQ